MYNKDIILVAIVILIVSLSLLIVPIYKSYLVQARVAHVSDVLIAFSTAALADSSQNHSWPHGNLAPDFANKHSYHIPPKMHLIWLGGVMPAEYLENLRQLALFSNNTQTPYSVNIWTDQSSRNANAIFQQINGLTVRHIESELLRKVLATDSPYTDREKTRFLNWVLFEYLPPANYGAVSDLFRIEILRQEGGLYLDTDTMINDVANMTSTKFVRHLQALFKNVETNGGFSCRKNGHITNNNIIIAANEYLISSRLKTLVQHMLSSMTTEYFNKMHNCFKNTTSYLIAKKSPVPIAAAEHKSLTGLHQDFINQFTSNETPAMRALTMIEGPYKLALLAAQYLPVKKHIASIFTMGPMNRNISGAPGLIEMERIFNCYRNDNSWLDKTPKTAAEQKIIIEHVNQQVNFYLTNIHNKDLQELSKAIPNAFLNHYAQLNIKEIL